MIQRIGPNSVGKSQRAKALSRRATKIGWDLYWRDAPLPWLLRNDDLRMTIEIPNLDAVLDNLVLLEKETNAGETQN